MNENDTSWGHTGNAIYLSESDGRVEKLALEAQKKFPAKNKMSEASRDIRQAIGMPITLKDVRKWTKSIIVVSIENHKNLQKRHEMKRMTAIDKRPWHKHKPTKVDKDKIVTKYNDYNCLTTSGTLCIGREIASL